MSEFLQPNPENISKSKVTQFFQMLRSFVAPGEAPKNTAGSGEDKKVLSRRQILGIDKFDTLRQFADQDTADQDTSIVDILNKLHFSRRVVIQTIGATTVFSLFALPEIFIQQVAAQEKETVLFYLPISEFLAPIDGKGNTFKINFEELASSYPDLIIKRNGGYELIAPDGVELVVDFPAGKTIELLASNVTTPTVLIENIPLSDYGLHNDKSEDVLTTAGITIYGKSIRLACSDANQKAVLDARGLDRALFVKSGSTENGQLTLENISIINNNPYTHDEVHGLYRAAPAAISIENMNVQVNQVELAPLPSSELESFDPAKYEASVNKISTGMLIIYTDDHGKVEVRNSVLKSNWDAVSITAASAEVLVDNTTIHQTQDGIEHSRRGAGLGLTRVEKSSTITVTNSDFYGVKLIGIFKGNYDEAEQKPKIFIKDSTLEPIRWATSGDYELTNVKFRENGSHQMNAGNERLLSQQHSDSVFELNEASQISSLEIQVDPELQIDKGDLIPVLDLGVQDITQPLASSLLNKVQNLTFLQNGESIQVDTAQLQSCLQHAVTELQSREGMNSLTSWKHMVVWDLENKRVGIVFSAQDTNTSWELHCWGASNEMIRVRQADLLAEKTMDEFVAAENAKEEVLDARWVRDGNSYYVMKITRTPHGTQQLTLSQAKIGIMTQQAEIRFTGLCYETKLGENIQFNQWAVDGDETGYFEFSAQINGFFAESQFFWGRKDSEIKNFLQAEVEKSKTKYVEELKQKYPNSFCAEINISSLEFNPTAKDRNIYLVYGYYDELNRPVLRMFSLEKRASVDSLFQGNLYVGVPGEVITGTAFDLTQPETFTFQSSITFEGQTTQYSTPQRFSWGQAQIAALWQGDQAVAATPAPPEMAMTAIAETLTPVPNNEVVNSPQLTATPESIELLPVEHTGTPEDVIKKHIVDRYQITQPELIGPSSELLGKTATCFITIDSTGEVRLRRMEITGTDATTIREESGVIYRTTSQTENVIVTAWKQNPDDPKNPTVLFTSEDDLPIYYQYTWGVNREGFPQLEEEKLFTSKQFLLFRYFKENVVSENGVPSTKEIFNMTDLIQVPDGFHQYFIVRTDNELRMKRLEIGNDVYSTQVNLNHGGIIIDTPAKKFTVEWTPPVTGTVAPKATVSVENDFGTFYYSYTWGVNSEKRPSLDAIQSRSAIEAMIKSKYGNDISLNPTIYNVPGGYHWYFVTKEENKLILHRALLGTNDTLSSQLREEVGVMYESLNITQAGLDVIVWPNTETPPPAVEFSIPNDGSFTFTWGVNSEKSPTRK